MTIRTHTQGKVVVYQSEGVQYPKTPPYNPPETYPEYLHTETDPENAVYAAVRETMRLLGLDAENYGTREWNPLGEFILPGNHVVIKPNLVLDKSKLPGGDLFSVIVHPSVLRPLIDYTKIALKGEGRITIADSPLQSADFTKIKEQTGLSEMLEYVGDVGLIDLRRELAVFDGEGLLTERIPLPGDPRGYAVVDLGRESELNTISSESERFWVTNYNLEPLMMHHAPGVNEYLVSKTVLDADVVITVPKLKTHRKVGATLSLKNTVGIVGDKSWLPHHRAGTPCEGGDEYPKRPPAADRVKSALRAMLEKDKIAGTRILRAYRIIKSLTSQSPLTPGRIMEGDWHGNDTIWRTVLDLNRILLYARKDGVLEQTIQRKCFVFIDGILAGEGEGPLMPTPKECGILVAGGNQALTDAVCARLMGFDYEKIPLIRNAFKRNDHPLTTYNPSDITIYSNKAHLRGIFKDASNIPFNFVAPYGWANHIEV